MGTVAGIEVKEGMSDDDRRKVLQVWKAKCENALHDPNTNTDDFFTAMIGWALMTDKINEIDKSK